MRGKSQIKVCRGRGAVANAASLSIRQTPLLRRSERDHLFMQEVFPSLINRTGRWKLNRIVLGWIRGRTLESPEDDFHRCRQENAVKKHVFPGKFPTVTCWLATLKVQVTWKSRMF